jgi:hypothetical protein
MRTQWYWDKYLYWGGILIASTIAIVSTDFGYDTLWHIPTGDWILTHGTIPHADVFSATKLGEPWVAHEWLSDVLLALAYNIFGWAGVLLLTSACIAGAFAILSGFLTLGRPEPLRGLLLLLFALALTQVTFITRPHVIVAPLLAFWVVRLVSAVEDKRRPSFLLLPLMTLWANLHSSFVVGLALTAPLALEAVADEADRRTQASMALQWFAFTLLSILAALITPHSIKGILFPVQVQNQDVALGSITEWLPYAVTSIADPLLIFLLMLIGFGVSGTLRLKALRLLPILVLLYLALRHFRHVLLLGFLAPVLLATPFCGPRLNVIRSPSQTSRQQQASAKARRRSLLAVVSVIVMAAGLALGAAIREKPFRPDERVTVQAAITYAKHAGLTGPVLNEYSLGGSLIFHGIAPFIDGRADMYGDELLEDYLGAVRLRAENSPAPLFELLDGYHIQWTLFQPRAQVLSALSMSTEWERAYADDFAVIFRRADQSLEGSSPQPQSQGKSAAGPRSVRDDLLAERAAAPPASGPQTTTQ